MEFFKTKLFGGEVNVLFTGPNYFFFHGFYGVICIAERVDEVELSNPSDEQVKKGAKEVLCYDYYDIDLGERPVMSDTQIIKIRMEFKDNGFNVTKEAIMHNYSAWRRDYKSGYRDEKNGYHLFSPCGCNPFSLRATSLHQSCNDWQETYEA